MAEIRAFRGVHYNTTLIPDLAAVICPPYDIIPPQMQEDLYAKTDFNFIRVEYPKETPFDSAADNKYSRAAAALNLWANDKVLVTDDKPAIYLHDQHFMYDGKSFKRRGMIVRVRLEEWDRRIVRPHENTMSEPKADRLNVLNTLQANTSPVFGLFEDEKKQIAKVLAEQEHNRPHLTARKVNGEENIVWAITDLTAISRISGLLADKPVYIADGHHRYESALNYKRQQLTLNPKATGEEAFNFVMMVIVDFADPGLLILPTHRLMKGIPEPLLNGLIDRLGIFFEIEEIKKGLPAAWSDIDKLHADTKATNLVLFGLGGKRFLSLKLRNPASVNQMMPPTRSEIYKKMDVSVIDHVMLEHLLTTQPGKENISLAYVHDRVEAVSRVANGEYQLAFITSPVRSQTIKDIADISDKMPRKSTYFYPKLPSGLIVNSLV